MVCCCNISILVQVEGEEEVYKPDLQEGDITLLHPDGYKKPDKSAYVEDKNVQTDCTTDKLHLENNSDKAAKT